MGKDCSKCGTHKDLSCFGVQYGKPRSQCRECEAEYSAKHYRKNKDVVSQAKRRWREQNPDKNRASLLKSKYGISLGEYDCMLQKQLHSCAICGVDLRNSKVNIDHDHATQKVRGLLCSHCNLLLGQAKDSVSILESAIKYLSQQSIFTP